NNRGSGRYISERKTFMKKLYNIFKVGNYRDFEFARVNSMIKAFDLKVNIDEKNKAIILDNQTNIKDLLNIFNELYYVSELSNIRMRVNEANVVKGS
ncbi:Kiwa anti-phage protein KwaB-like domain-containing protein, partial [Petrotoga sp. 9PWA.NaAc.5.4]|uniref:Kiwa anti-phage protein KwaB-like domain-containing protein n=1 Tax=Petrotoga sp. 9PWA.NaAc.5.4 TaxID=1434328 RepID=UPI000EFC98DA